MPADREALVATADGADVVADARAELRAVLKRANGDGGGARGGGGGGGKKPSSGFLRGAERRQLRADAKVFRDDASHRERAPSPTTE